MSRVCDRPVLRLAMMGVLAAALSLAACGRKGPLAPPPGAALAGDQSVVGGRQVMRTHGGPRALRGPDKHIPLDNLLN